MIGKGHIVGVSPVHAGTKVANSWHGHFPVSYIKIQRILNNLPCIDLHTETFAGKARSLLQNIISGEFSRLPLDRILCHGAHDKATNLADRASENRPSSEFFAGWPKILDGHTGPFWVSSFVLRQFISGQGILDA